MLPPKLGEHELAVALEPGQQQKGSEEELAVDAVWTPCSLIVTAAIFRASTHQGERGDRASVSARRVAQPISFDTGKKKVPCTSNEDPSIARQDYIVGSSSKDLGGDDSEPTRVRDSACEMMANSNATSELDCSRSRRRRRCAAAAAPGSSTLSVPSRCPLFAQMPCTSSTFWPNSRRSAISSTRVRSSCAWICPVSPYSSGVSTSYSPHTGWRRGCTSTRPSLQSRSARTMQRLTASER